MHFCAVCLAETPFLVCETCMTSPTPWPPAGLERCRRWLWCPHGVFIGQRCGECAGGYSEGFQEMGEAA